MLKVIQKLYVSAVCAQGPIDAQLKSGWLWGIAQFYLYPEPIGYIVMFYWDDSNISQPTKLTHRSEDLCVHTVKVSIIQSNWCNGAFLSPIAPLSSFLLKSYYDWSCTESVKKYLAKALAKCLHSLLIGHALQFGLLLVQKTCMVDGKKSFTHLYVSNKWDSWQILFRITYERGGIRIEISTSLYGWAWLSWINSEI